jgi:hypothetical protein
LEGFVTTETKCPECGWHLMVLSDFPYWKRCPQCLWDEKWQLDEKIRQELANDPEGA